MGSYYPYFHSRIGGHHILLNKTYVRQKILMAVNIDITVFWEVTGYNVCRQACYLGILRGQHRTGSSFILNYTYIVFYMTVILKKNVLHSKYDFLEKCAIKF